MREAGSGGLRAEPGSGLAPAAARRRAAADQSLRSPGRSRGDPAARRARRIDHGALDGAAADRGRAARVPRRSAWTARSTLCVRLRRRRYAGHGTRPRACDRAHRLRSRARRPLQHRFRDRPGRSGDRRAARRSAAERRASAVAVASRRRGLRRPQAECERDDGFVERRVRRRRCSPPAPIAGSRACRWSCPTTSWRSSVRSRSGRSPSSAARADEYGQEGSPTWVEDVQPVTSIGDGAHGRPPGRCAFDAALDAVLAEIDGSARRGDACAHARASPSTRRRGAHGCRLGAGRACARRPAASRDRGAARRGRSSRAAQLGVGVRRVRRGARSSPPEVAARRTAGRSSRRSSARSVPTSCCGRAPRTSAARRATARVLDAALRAHRPRIVLAPATGLGRDLVPRVAARRASV